MPLKSPDGFPSESGRDQCRVLIVDDDTECLAEYIETISALGYSCQGTSSAVNALKLISTDSKIGIIVTDVQMPAMDGLTLLDELASRFMEERPLVTLIITGRSSLQTAVQAMRSNATDFLTKPVTFQDLAAAMRRASVRWTRLLGKSKLEALTRLASAHEEVNAEGAPSQEASAPSQEQLKSFVRSIIKSRQNRAHFLDPSLFADPAWDILLDLTSAALEGKAVPASSVSAASQALSTTLRYVRQLTDAGLIRSWRDPEDKRRTLVELELETFHAMQDYLISVRRQQMSGLT